MTAGYRSSKLSWLRVVRCGRYLRARYGCTDRQLRGVPEGTRCAGRRHCAGAAPSEVTVRPDQDALAGNGLVRPAQVAVDIESVSVEHLGALDWFRGSV